MLSATAPMPVPQRGQVVRNQEHIFSKIPDVFWKKYPLKVAPGCCTPGLKEKAQSFLYFAGAGFTLSSAACLMGYCDVRTVAQATIAGGTLGFLGEATLGTNSKQNSEAPLLVAKECQRRLPQVQKILEQCLEIVCATNQTEEVYDSLLPKIASLQKAGGNFQWLKESVEKLIAIDQKSYDLVDELNDSFPGITRDKFEEIKSCIRSRRRIPSRYDNEAVQLIKNYVENCQTYDETLRETKKMIEGKIDDLYEYESTLSEDITKMKGFLKL